MIEVTDKKYAGYGSGVMLTAKHYRAVCKKHGPGFIFAKHIHAPIAFFVPDDQTIDTGLTSGKFGWRYEQVHMNTLDFGRKCPMGDEV